MTAGHCKTQGSRTNEPCSTFIELSFVSERAVKIGRRRSGFVFPTQDRHAIKTPVDATSIPPIRTTEFACILDRAFIDNLGVRNAGHKSVQETGQNPQLFAVLKTQRFTDPLPIGGRSFAHMNGRIKQTPTTSTHQLALCL